MKLPATLTTSASSMSRAMAADSSDAGAIGAPAPKPPVGAGAPAGRSPESCSGLVLQPANAARTMAAVKKRGAGWRAVFFVLMGADLSSFYGPMRGEATCGSWKSSFGRCWSLLLQSGEVDARCRPTMRDFCRKECNGERLQELPGTDNQPFISTYRPIAGGRTEGVRCPAARGAKGSGGGY